MGETTRLIPIAETALTLAALEMATVGIGVAWVPESLARPRLREGVIADLSDPLQTTPLDVMAVRLAGTSGSVMNAVWDKITTYASA
jgi:DNA-binding transcriptional LysR family regulator